MKKKLSVKQILENTIVTENEDILKHLKIVKMRLQQQLIEIDNMIQFQEKLKNE